METGNNASAEAVAYTNAHTMAHTHDHATMLAHSHPKAQAHSSDFAGAHAVIPTNHEFRTVAKAHAHAKAVIALRDLATDCLRLSMHFFHPIQQCAQQVYHTAVPLSPTSSQLHKSCLQSIVDNQLSPVTAFLGAPHTWGLLLRTIDTRPRKVDCIATSGRRIISACEDILNIYDAVTGVVQQSMHVPEKVVKIQSSPDGSILFLAHPSFITMWDVQTGGLIHTFNTQSKINDIAVSVTYIACGSSDGSIIFWDIHTKEEGKGFGNGQSVVSICWLSTQDLVVATQGTLYIHNIVGDNSSVWFHTKKHIWGVVYLEDHLLVGISWKVSQVNQCTFVAVDHAGKIIKQKFSNSHDRTSIHREWLLLDEDVTRQISWPGRECGGQLEGPVLVGEEIVCITPPTGVQSFNTDSQTWTQSPSLLGTARSVAASLGRNIVVQTNDSVQIFSTGVLIGGKASKDIHPSFIYSLGEKYIIWIQSDRRVTLLELETLKCVHPDNNTSPFWSLFANLSPFSYASPTPNQSPFASASFSHGLVAMFGISSIMQAWHSAAPLPEWREAVDEEVPLSGLSPMCTLVITVQCSLPRLNLCIEDAKHGTMLAKANLQLDNLGTGSKVYDIVFDSETRFYLKIDGPGGRIQVPHDITPSPSGYYSHRVTMGEPMPLSEPQAHQSTSSLLFKWEKVEKATKSGISDHFLS